MGGKKHKSVILFSEWKKPLQALSLEQKGRILDALLDFPDGIRPEFDDPLLLMAWAFMEGPLNTNAKKWEDIREKRAAAGRKGAEATNAKHQQSAANPANDDFANQNRQSTANPAVTVTGNVTVTDHVTVTDREKDASASTAPAKSSRFHPPDIAEVRAYFAEKGGTDAQAQRFMDFYTSNGWKVGKNPMKSWKAAASGWMSRDKERQQAPAFQRNPVRYVSRPPEEAEKAGDFLKNASTRTMKWLEEKGASEKHERQETGTEGY